MEHKQQSPGWKTCVCYTQTKTSASSCCDFVVLMSPDFLLCSLNNSKAHDRSPLHNKRKYVSCYAACTDDLYLCFSGGDRLDIIGLNTTTIGLRGGINLSFMQFKGRTILRVELFVGRLIEEGLRTQNDTYKAHLISFKQGVGKWVGSTVPNSVAQL